ncbi:MAG: hypothetical protein QOH65_3371 [Methylobacteriaceae bacterium]|jgi:hypothetical protein|nr:hypothetical protein [Methylobacteriaceae bacterium]
MPLYFFDITDTGKTWPDSEGTELASLEEAREEALRTLGEIVKDKLPDGDHRNFLIEIREGDGAPLLSASLSLRVARKMPG